MFIDLLRSLHGPKLLRLKGIVKIAEKPEQPLVIHGVQHVLHPPARLERWPDADQRTRIVLITRDLEPASRATCSTPFSAPRARPAGPRRAPRQSARPVRRRRSLTACVAPLPRCRRPELLVDACISPAADARRDRRRSGSARLASMRLERGVDLPQGCAAHAANDDADRQTSDARLSARDRGARATVRRRAGAALGPRELHLSGARGARQPICALDDGAGPSQGRHGLPDDAEPARIHGRVARHHPRPAAWWRSSTPT